MRASNPSPAWQNACAEYEQRTRQPVTKEQFLTTLLNKELQEIATVGDMFRSCPGFDLGILLAPPNDAHTVTKGGTLWFSFYPIQRPQENTHHGWPLESGPCMLGIPLQADSSVLWGLVGTAIPTNELNILPQSATDTDRFNVARMHLKRLPTVPLFVGQGSKHCFLNHALNALVDVVSAKLGRQPETVRLRDESEVSLADDGNTLVAKTKPRFS